MVFTSIEALKNAIARYIIDNKEMFDYMNLKMPDASYIAYDKADEYGFTIEQANDIFCDWCDTNYHFFKEDLMYEHDIDFNDYCYALDGTSSFCLHDRDMINLNNSLEENVCCVIDVMIDENWYSYMPDCGSNNFADEFEYDVDFRNYVLNGLYGNFMEWCKPIKIIYDKIKDFKEGQAAYFMEELKFTAEKRDYEEEQYKKDSPLTARENALETVDKLLKAGKKIQLELDKNGDVKILELNLRKVLDN